MARLWWLKQGSPQYLLLKPHIPADFDAEVRAAAKAAGIDEREYMNLQVFPELVKAACTMVGAWGSATPNGKLVQLRALDWAVNTPLQQWPLVTVIHQNASSAFSMLSWPGFHGALTGMSTRMGICEKVWLAYDGKSDRAGIPFTVLLRNILESDVRLEDAITRMQQAKRTCSVWLGIGSWEENKFNAVGYAYENITVYDDSNLEVGNAQHPQIQDVVYVDKHKQPSHDPCLGNILEALHSQITAETLARNVTAIHGTGDTHLAVYDYTNMQMYVSNASPWVNNTAVPAYARPFVLLDMASLFARPNTK